MTIRGPGHANGADPSAGQHKQAGMVSVTGISQVRKPGRTTERGKELRDRAIAAAERTREAVGQTPTDRWATLAAAGVALITLTVIVRRVRRS
jgi:hypothetical protein